MSSTGVSGGEPIAWLNHFQQLLQGKHVERCAGNTSLQMTETSCFLGNWEVRRVEPFLSIVVEKQKSYVSVGDLMFPLA